VPDVNAAIKLARDFQRSDAYDLFRGQARLRPVYSGAVRLEMETGKSHFDIFKNRLLDFKNGSPRRLTGKSSPSS
jgi:hypothetical protein